MRGFLLAGLLLALIGLAGLQLSCQRADSPASASSSAPASPWFEDVTEKMGLRFVHDAGPVGDYFMPQQVGSGAALFDFNKDGRLDVYLLQNGGPRSTAVNRLYQQMPDGRFTDVSKGSGLDIVGHNMGVAVGDVNNDGWPDVLVTQYGGVQLFLNNGDGTFRDATEMAGLSNPSWGTSAAFFDYDRDGWLDLVVVNYVDYDPTWPCTGPYGQPDYWRSENVPRTCQPAVSQRRRRFVAWLPRCYGSVGFGPAAGARLGGRLCRSQRRRLAGYFHCQRRQTKPPLGQSTRRHLSRRGGPARPGLQRHGPGPSQHGYCPGRRGWRRLARPLRHAFDGREQHALAPGTARPVPRSIGGGGFSPGVCPRHGFWRPPGRF